ncbi:MAG: recombination protein NinG [Bacteroides sp.]|nr:recombination protein NinG [Bacteroides sp.]
MKGTKSELITRLDNVFSLYIRLRDASPNGTFRCISCGQIKSFEQADCGHYISRQHMSLRFDEKNCNAQCKTCNEYQDGNIQRYRMGLITKYGEETVEWMESQKNQINKISESDLRDKIAYYRKEVKRLEKEKSIK